MPSEMKGGEPPYDYKLVLLRIPEERLAAVLAAAGHGAFYAERSMDPNAFRRAGRPMLDHGVRRLGDKLADVLEEDERRRSDG